MTDAITQPEFVLSNLNPHLKEAYNEHIDYINHTPEVQSLLYDLDLLPEQIMNERNFVRMLQIAQYIKYKNMQVNCGVTNVG